ncbi:hypothetical protein O4H49_11630 [Kiloniella laminariae]|uniref:Uncharacterized protein n=1 Tax=Kiloniella laminariae TaxID=454162 RepID=A0ABT4LK26_9PROT|nr:hypothetical protein [Kiloniella laminariae]MCZ4281432.1 hypothetical protein [Kiloniella laminariae]
MEKNHRFYAQFRTTQDAARPEGNHGYFFFRREMLERQKRSYKDPLKLFRIIRTKQDQDRPAGATDMFMHRD